METPSRPGGRRLPHDILGVAADATAAEIDAAYRRALRRLHPDTQAATRSDAALDRHGRRGDGGDHDRGDAEPLTVADLQAAREQMHRARKPAARPGRADAGAVGQRPRPTSAGAGRPWPDGWHYRAGGRPADIVAGPVRYHGPAGTAR
jgi:hypothetical protein